MHKSALPNSVAEGAPEFRENLLSQSLSQDQPSLIQEPNLNSSANAKDLAIPLGQLMPCSPPPKSPASPQNKAKSILLNGRQARRQNGVLELPKLKPSPTIQISKEWMDSGGESNMISNAAYKRERTMGDGVKKNGNIELNIMI